MKAVRSSDQINTNKVYFYDSHWVLVGTIGSFTANGGTSQI